MYHQGQPKLPLPPTRFEDEPRYVNAKQYIRIMKMREKRQKQPDKLKIIKKYKHQSRHEHAVRRRRCSNGRFVSKSDTDKQDDMKRLEDNGLDAKDVSDSSDKIEIQKSEYKVVD